MIGLVKLCCLSPFQNYCHHIGSYFSNNYLNFNHFFEILFCEFRGIKVLIFNKKNKDENLLIQEYEILLLGRWQKILKIMKLIFLSI